MGYTTMTTPGGEELVVLSRADFDSLREAAAAAEVAEAMRIFAEVEAGHMEIFTDAEVEASLAAPLAFWRKRRGLTQEALAERADIAVAELLELERGAVEAHPAVFVRLARALGVRVEDLVIA